MWVGKITNELEEVLGVEWMVVAQLKSEKMYQQVHSTYLVSMGPQLRTYFKLQFHIEECRF